MTGYIVIAAKYIYCTKYAWHFEENQVAHTHTNTHGSVDVTKHVCRDCPKQNEKTNFYYDEWTREKEKCEQTMGRD